MDLGVEQKIGINLLRNYNTIFARLKAAPRLG